LQGLLPQNPIHLINLIARLVVSASFKSPGSRFYNLQLDHWGFSRRLVPNPESFQTMYTRLLNDVQNWWLWDWGHHGFHDNSIPGISGINGLDAFAGGPSRDIYYFTMSFSATDAFPNRTLFAKDINSFFALFPLSQLWDPWGV
jgi:hypothetical protein